jgi:hypothetical protein
VSIFSSFLQASQTIKFELIKSSTTTCPTFQYQPKTKIFFIFY